MDRDTLVRAYLNATKLARFAEVHLACIFRETGLQDITPAQAHALGEILRAGGSITARQLAERLDLSEVTVGRFLHSLEAHGWVTRRPSSEDARAVVVEPTPRVTERYPQVVDATVRMFERAFAGLSEDQLLALAETTDQILSNLRTYRAPSVRRRRQSVGS